MNQFITSYTAMKNNFLILTKLVYQLNTIFKIRPVSINMNFKTL